MFFKRVSPTANILSVFSAMVQALTAIADREDKRAENVATKADKSSMKFREKQAKLAQREARRQEKLLADREAALKEADDARAAAARIQQHLIGNQA